MLHSMSRCQACCAIATVTVIVSASPATVCTSRRFPQTAAMDFISCPPTSRTRHNSKSDPLDHPFTRRRRRWISSQRLPLIRAQNFSVSTLSEQVPVDFDHAT